MPNTFSNSSKANKETVIRIIGYFLQQWELESAADPEGEEGMEKLWLFRLLPESKYHDLRGEILQVVKLALGQNFSLSDGKLDITLAKPFLILKNGLSGVSLQKVASEPSLYLDLQRENAPLGGVNFSWSGA
jgi:hypothetical protein